MSQHVLPDVVVCVCVCPDVCTVKNILWYSPVLFYVSFTYTLTSVFI